MAVPDKTTAFIIVDGVEYPILASSPVQWGFKEGVKPVIKDFDVRPTDKDAILAAAFTGNAALRISTISGTITYEFLTVLSDMPGDEPNTFRIRLADRRWVWNRKWILKRMNIRRIVGFRRASFNQGRPEIEPVNPDVFYAAFSLQDPDDPTSKWDGLQVILNILATDDGLGDADILQNLFISPLEIRFDNGIEQQMQEIPIEELVFDDTGDLAVARLLAYYPSIGIYPDEKGLIHLYSKVDGSEAKILENMGLEFVGQGHAEFITSEHTRPEAVDVFFTREAEVRFDFIEVGSVVDRSTVVENDKKINKQRFVENVLQVPDFELEVTDLQTNEVKTVTQGTWITFQEALNAWNKILSDSPLGLLTNIDFDQIQEALVNHIDLWSAFALNGVFDPDADWSSRISEIQRHYRRTFRINKVWMDNILDLKPHLVATIDPVNGTRAPALAFSDYAIKPSQRAIMKQIIGPLGGITSRGVPYVINVDGFPPNDILDENTKPAPANVTIVDKDQGIIRVDYLVDPIKLAEAIYPSKLDEATIPVDGKFDGKNPISFDSVSRSITRAGRRPKLSSGHKIAILLSAVPAAPNNLNQLERIRIVPNRNQGLRDLLPVAMHAGLNNARGPIRQVHIGGGIEFARIKWDDRRKKETERLFGLADDDKKPDLNGMIVNRADQDDIREDAASLNAIALAIAAKIYADEHDRYLGSYTSFNVNTRPGGSISEVNVQVQPDGVVPVTATLPETVPELSFQSLLPSATRDLIFKYVKGRE